MSGEEEKIQTSRYLDDLWAAPCADREGRIDPGMSAG
jgi:hypothetical protein